MSTDDIEQNIIYKYRPPTKRVLENLNDGILWFSPPKSFNDPFDCMINGYYKATPDEWRRWLERQPETQAKKEVVWNQLEKSNFDGSEYFKNRQIDNLRVLSLSETNSSVLMWSHYAQYHAGICYGFNITEIGDSLGILFEEKDVSWTAPGVKKGFLPMFPVDYKIAMPRPFDFVTEADTKRLMEFALRKHSDWTYECEQRIVVTPNMIKHQGVHYNKDELSEVIFGFKVSEETINVVSKAIQKCFPGSGKNVIRKRAVPIKGQYAVSIVDM